MDDSVGGVRTLDRSWHVISAKVRGSSHARTESPCQDAFAHDLVTLSDGTEYLLVAVCDGAGSASHSDVGSQLAVETAVNEGRRVAQVLHGNGANTVPRRLDPRLKRAALELVTTTRRRLVRESKVRAKALRDFACTFLFVAVGPQRSLFLQIGDGAIVFAEPGLPAEYRLAFGPQNGEYANTTNFLTDSRYAERLEHDFSDRPIEHVALMTDGIQGLVVSTPPSSDSDTSRVHGPFFNRAFSPLKDNPSPEHLAFLQDRLQSTLAGPLFDKRTDDDRTLVLGCRNSSRRLGQDV
jgi:hypothetical protein